MRRAAAFLSLAALGLLAACSGTTPYRDGGEKNLEVRTELSGSRLRASLEVYRIDAQCKMEYEGTVALDAPLVATGIPTGRPTILVFTFASSPLFGARGTVSRQTLVQPRPGYRYRIDARYKDDIYDIALSEISREGTARRLELSTQGACK